MTNEEFINKAKRLVADYINDHCTDTLITTGNVFVVWSCKTLQNRKAILANDIPHNHLLFEVTMNGDKKEIYLDVYDKLENRCIKAE